MFRHVVLFNWTEDARDAQRHGLGGEVPKLPDVIDSIRLYQRFIELHKKNFWISLYPLERHGFVHADSWYDEYRRIDELFNTYVKPVKGIAAGN